MPYKDPEKERAYHKAYNAIWDRENREARRKINQKHDQIRKGTAPRRKQQASDRQRRHVRQRVAVIDKYGGCCAFCRTNQYEHLTIDHINGDGKAHRAATQSQYRGISDFLYRTEFRPDLYRVLCWNCHMAMTRHGVQPGGEPLHSMSWWHTFSALRRKPNS